MPGNYYRVRGEAGIVGGGGGRATLAIRSLPNEPSQVIHPQISSFVNIPQGTRVEILVRADGRDRLILVEIATL